MEAGKAPIPPASVPVRRLQRQHRVLLRVVGLCGLVLAMAFLFMRLLAGSPSENVMFIAVALTVGGILLGWLCRPPGRRQDPTPPAVPSSFRQISDNLPDAVIIAGADQVLYANASAGRMLGIRAEMPATALSELRAARTQQPSLARLLLHHPCGGAFQASLSAGPVVHEGQAAERFVIRDLSELEQGRAALAASNAELQAMAGRLFSLQEDERRSISRDLHDDIGQAITAMKLAAFAAREEDLAERRREDIDQIIELADSTVIRLRNLSMLLRPPQLDALGLEAALRWQAGMLFRSTPVELLLDVRTLSQRPGNEVEQACFRIAQEGLTNALRHARASQVSLLLQDAPEGGLHLRVIDDGEGFDPNGPRGLGMIVMRERAQSAGGRLRIETAPGEGTCIDLHLPCPALPH